MIPMKRALILAAGIGRRLGDLTKDIPKCLLQVNNEEEDNTLIDFSLSSLKENGIEEIIIVSGFAEEKLKTHILKRRETQFSFQFIFNNKYSKHNNIYSAYLAKDLINDETVLLNSDIIFHPLILKNLVSVIRKEKYQRSYLVIDDKKSLTTESMKVSLNEKGEIKKINKNLNLKNSFGEYIGITYLRGSDRLSFVNSLMEHIGNKNLDLYYEDALASVLKDISVFPFSTEGKLWTEIDTKEDYTFAKKIARKIKEAAVL